MSAGRGICLIIGIGLMGCWSAGVEEKGKRDTEAFDPSVVAPLVISEEMSNVAFRFLDRTTGEMRTVMQREDVPNEVREAVLTVDLTPNASHHPRALFVADLREPGANGTYSVRVVDRFAYDAARRTERLEVEEKAANRKPVVMFSAEWCGACKQAAKWLRSNQIPFQERDIEKDPSARGDLSAAARKAGLNPKSVAGSVPVFVVGGKVLKGFQPKAIQAALP